MGVGCECWNSVKGVYTGSWGSRGCSGGGVGRGEHVRAEVPSSDCSCAAQSESWCSLS